MDAQTPTQQDKVDVRRWALLIGANHYQEEAFRSLRYCVNDATEMQAALTAWAGSGYTNDRVRLLTSDKSGEATATRTAILEQLVGLIAQAGSDDLLLFYFAGHGEVVENDVYLIPADAKPDLLLPHTALSLAEIKRLMMLSHARSKVIILDACYTGILTASDLGRRGTSQIDSEAAERAVVNVQHMAEHAEGLAILHAGSRGDPAMEIPGFKHGLFTYFLLEGLRGAANTQRDSAITIQELYEYVITKIASWAQDNGGKAQRPTYQLEGYGDLTLINVPSDAVKPLSGSKPKSGGSMRLLPPLGDALLAPLRGKSEFVGRLDELRRIKQMLETTTDMALLVRGEPGIGKTSIIHRVKLMLDGEMSGNQQFRHFSIEPTSIATGLDFARELRAGLVRSSGTNVFADKPFVFETVFEFGADLEAIQNAMPGTTFVVFLDEFDKIVHQCTDLEQNRIRGLINYLVVYTSFPVIFFLSALQDLAAHYGSVVPTLPLVLHMLTRPESDEMILNILSGYTTPTLAELEWMYGYTGGHPYLARLLLAKLSEHNLGAGSSQVISEEALERALKAALHSKRAEDLLSGLYSSLLSDEQRYVLLWLAATDQITITADQVNRMGASLRTALRELTVREYLAAQDDGGYCFRVGFIKDWLRNWARFQLELESLNVPTEQGASAAPYPGAAPPQIPAKGVCVDLSTQRVYVEGEETKEALTDQQYRALVFLVERTGQVVSPDKLAEHIWPGEAYEVDDQRIAQVVHRIRVALGDRQKPFKYLATLPKRGYRLQYAQTIRTGIALISPRSA